MTRGDHDDLPKERSKLFPALIGIGALLIWFAALWFMFGDVL